MRLSEFIIESAIKELPYEQYPTIGWWLDHDPIRFYHGTHVRNFDYVAQHGLVAPTSGDTAGWISLALEPNTANGYASMSAAGGETAYKDFRGAGTKSKTTTNKERVVFVIELPKDMVLANMAPARGAMEETRTKLTNREEYEAFDGFDQLYYALTEIRMPDRIDPKYIKGYMKK